MSIHRPLNMLSMNAADAARKYCIDNPNSPVCLRRYRPMPLPPPPIPVGVGPYRTTTTEYRFDRPVNPSGMAIPLSNNNPCDISKIPLRIKTNEDTGYILANNLNTYIIP